MTFLGKLFGKVSRKPFSEFEQEAAALTSRGLYAEAAAVWEGAASAYPESFAVHNNLAKSFLSSGQKQRALGAMSKAVELAPSDSDLHRNYGIVLMENGNVDEAVTQFRIAHDIDPSNFAAYLNLADAHEQLGNREEVVRLERHVLEESLRAGSFKFHAEAVKRLRTRGLELASPAQIAESQFIALDVERQKDIIKGYFRIFGRAWLTNGYKGGTIVCDSCSTLVELGDVFYNNTDCRVRCARCMDTSLNHWTEDRTNLGFFGSGVIADAIRFNKPFSAM